MSPAGSDRRARLEEDRDFLLASLDDLELEYAAGDMDEDDYRSLRSDYTARAAGVIRAIADAETSTDDRATRRPGRAVAWVLGVAGVAVIAGLLLAQFSGSRRSGESVTGDIRTTTRELMFDAQQAFAAGETEAALEIYDQVLEIQPANVEALTYRAWLTSRTGDPAAAVAGLEDAIAIDPDYVDAHVFRAIVALDLDDPDTAAEELAAFDALDPSPFALQLVTDAQVRERIALARVTSVLLVDDPPAFSESGLTVADVSGASEILAGEGELLQAVQLFDSVLAEYPQDVEALTYRGWLIARAGDAQLLQGGIEMLTSALEIDPDYAPALVFRAFALNEAGDRAGAAADLAAFDALADQPADLVRLIDEFHLRESVIAG